MSLRVITTQHWFHVFQNSDSDSLLSQPLRITRSELGSLPVACLLKCSSRWLSRKCSMNSTICEATLLMISRFSCVNSPETVGFSRYSITLDSPRITTGMHKMEDSALPARYGSDFSKLLSCEASELPSRMAGCRTDRTKLMIERGSGGGAAWSESDDAGCADLAGCRALRLRVVFFCPAALADGASCSSCACSTCTCTSPAGCLGSLSAATSMYRFWFEYWWMRNPRVARE